METIEEVLSSFTVDYISYTVYNMGLYELLSVVNKYGVFNFINVDGKWSIIPGNSFTVERGENKNER